ALSRLEGKPRRCRYWLAKAQDAAEREDNVWVRVEVLRQRAFLLRDEGLEEAASREALLASDLASRNGWYSRVQLLEREFGLGSRNTGSGSGSNSSGQGSESAFTVKLKRSLDALVQVTIAAGKMLEGRDLSRRVLA